MNEAIICPKCSSQYVYENRGVYICPECPHEWTGNELSENDIEGLLKDESVMI